MTTQEIGFWLLLLQVAIAPIIGLVAIYYGVRLVRYPASRSSGIGYIALGVVPFFGIALAYFRH